MNTTTRKNTISFILLLTGQTISQLGTSMTGFAVVVWVYSTTGRALASSLLTVCSMVPYLIVSLAGGAIADHFNKKKILLFCDAVAASGSLVILLCFCTGSLHLWILCAVNTLSGFMNAFQNPTSCVAVSLLVEKKDYTKVSGIQSVISSVTGILTPVAAAAILGLGGLGLVLAIDLTTFLAAFLLLLFFIKIPSTSAERASASIRELKTDIREGIGFITGESGLLLLLLLLSVLEFVGAVSFDSMYSPLLLSRTGNDEMTVGVVSAFGAAGCMLASLLLTAMKPPKRKLPLMFFGCILCLSGIMLFGMGQSLPWWCAVAFLGCFGSPVYQTCLTVLLRERVPIDMQGRVFSLHGMITGMLRPIGYLSGALLADHIMEPFMQKVGTAQRFFSILVGSGKGAGTGLIFVLAGLCGLIIVLCFTGNQTLRALDRSPADSSAA